MVTPVIMPKQGQSVESCILSTLYKKVGDVVAKGDLLFAYETDKASFEEPSQADGTVLAVFFQEGDEIPVYQNVMLLGAPGDDISAYGAETPAETPAQGQAQNGQTLQEQTLPGQTPASQTPASQMSAHQISESAVSPRARQLARRHRLDPRLLQGTGPGGRVVEADVLRALDERKPLTALALEKVEALGAGVEVPLRGTGLGGMVRATDVREPAPETLQTPEAQQAQTSDTDDFVWENLSHMRKLIGKAMARSLQNSAQLTHHLSADARRILALRKQVKKDLAQGSDADISLNDMVCFAVVRALEKFPQLNVHLVGDQIKQFKKVHLGLAVDTERGLMVPAVRNASDMSLRELSKALKAVAKGCKQAGGISPDLLSPEAAGFTVSNLGNYGVEVFTPIINLPQVAILGVNAIVPRPKELEDGVYAFVPHMGLSLTYDHRALDGGLATRFLKEIALQIENFSFEY